MKLTSTISPSVASIQLSCITTIHSHNNTPSSAIAEQEKHELYFSNTIQISPSSNRSELCAAESTFGRIAMFVDVPHDPTE